MPDIDLANFRVPEWIQIFLVSGIALVILAVPLRFLWKATRGMRRRFERTNAFADRVRERFQDVGVTHGLMGPATLRFTHENRKVHVALPDERTLLVGLEDGPVPRIPCVIRTRGRLNLPWAMVGFRILPRLRSFDPLVDDGIAMYTTPLFASWLHEQALQESEAGGKRQGAIESLLVLRKLPGVRRFRLSTDTEHPVSMSLNLRTEDLIHRPDELESLVHHLQKLNERLTIA